jgi:hypothetical protein
MGPFQVWLSVRPGCSHIPPMMQHIFRTIWPGNGALTRGNPIFTDSDIRASKLWKSDEITLWHGIATFACRNRFSLSERASYRDGPKTESHFPGRSYGRISGTVIRHREQDRVDV